MARFRRLDVEILIEVIGGAIEIVIEFLEYKFLASKYEDWAQESKRRREERKRRREERKRRREERKREKVSA